MASPVEGFQLNRAVLVGARDCEPARVRLALMWISEVRHKISVKIALDRGGSGAVIVIVGTILLGIGGLTVLAAIFVAALHAANKYPHHVRVPRHARVRMDAEGPPRPKINALRLAVALSCIGAGLLLLGVNLAITPN
jgi:hypothetical protein